MHIANIENITAKFVNEAHQNPNKLAKLLKEETFFKSKILREIMQDRYDYQGDKLNRVCVMKRRTGEPAELGITFTKVGAKDDSVYMEGIVLKDSNGEIVGTKDYTIKHDKNGYSMAHGMMDASQTDEYAGVGTRLDQIQFERAQELGIKEISRISVVDSIRYHFLNGFLPTSNGQIPLSKNSNRVMRFVDDLMNEMRTWAKTREIKIVPVVDDIDGERFIDVNKTRAYTYLNLCNELIREGNAYRLEWLNYLGTVRMVLDSKAFEGWQKLIKGHEILPKTNSVCKTGVLNQGVGA